MSRIKVDRDLCIGSELCVMEHPEAFELGPDRVAERLPGESELTDDERESLVENCPSGALSLGE